MTMLVEERSVVPIAFSERTRSFYEEWIAALVQVTPVYLAIHTALALLTLFAPLFTLNDFSVNNLPLHTLMQEWNRWDTGHYTAIAIHGYDGAWRTAFFPLFPLLERIGTLIFHDPFTVGLVIANLANLGLLMVLFQLIKEDFGHHRARNAVLYLSIFPSAFFFAAAYTESLFLFLALLSFYQMRRSRWWLAGLCGFFACITRSTGIFLVLPFVYEYLRLHSFSLKRIRLDVLALALIPTGLLVYSVYCQWKFRDALAWEHAQAVWYHQLMPPWKTLYLVVHTIRHGTPGLLSFQALHNLLDLLSIFFVLAMIALMFVGSTKLSREHMAYGVWSVPLVLFLLSVPVIGTPLLPLQSFPRFMLEIFPVFLVAGGLGEHRWFHESYVLVSGSLFFLSSLLFLTGHWMV